MSANWETLRAEQKAAETLEIARLRATERPEVEEWEGAHLRVQAGHFPLEQHP